MTTVQEVIEAWFEEMGIDIGVRDSDRLAARITALRPEGEAHGTDGDNMMRRYGPHVKALIAAGNGPGYVKALGGLFAAISDHVRKPEGEAPQAAWTVKKDAHDRFYVGNSGGGRSINKEDDPTLYRFFAEYRAVPAAQHADSSEDPTGDRWHSLTCDGTCSPPCNDAPAAQHAESGASAMIPVSAIREIVDSKYPVSRDDYASVNSILTKLEAVIALAAQSQGAQACGSYECRAGQRDGILCGEDGCDIALGVRTAQSQGAQATMRKCSKFGHRCNCATDCDPDKPHPSLAAQQAAAPGALAAQAAQLSIGFANNDQGVHVTVMQHHANNHHTVLHAGPVPAGDSLLKLNLEPK